MPAHASEVSDAESLLPGGILTELGRHPVARESKSVVAFLHQVAIAQPANRQHQSHAGILGRRPHHTDG